MLSIRIDLFLVLIAQCVESNPGPATKGRTGMQGNQGSEPTKPPETSPEMTPLQNNHESRAATRVRRSEVIHTSQKPSVSYGLLTQHSDASSQDPASTIDTIKDVFGDPGHPLHKRLQDLTKNRMKRTSLNHVLEEQQRKQSDILAPRPEKV